MLLQNIAGQIHSIFLIKLRKHVQLSFHGIPFNTACISFVCDMHMYLGCFLWIKVSLTGIGRILLTYAGIKWNRYNKMIN